MAKIIFNIDKTDYREAFNIELSVPDDMNIYEFKTVCVRMASAMGYTDLSIKKHLVVQNTKQRKIFNLKNL